MSSSVERVTNTLSIACIVRNSEEAVRDPDRFPCESRRLADVTNGRIKQQMSKGHVVESSEESEYPTINSRKAACSSEEVKWNFRRRDASDRSSQPHSAPTEIAAQQAENFQRFYRAVVSPTHVRVTAGGRIVPNTRTSAPPPFEWNSDKFHFEPRKAEVDGVHLNLQPTSWLHNAPPPPGFPALLPGGFPPQYHLLPRNNSVAMATMAPQIQTGPINNQQVPVNVESTILPPQTNVLPQPIKISPPTQFDQTKPFMFNGHLVYPMAHGFQPPPTALPLHMPILGNPTFLAQNPMTPPTNFYPPQFPGPLAGMTNPFMFPAVQQLPMGLPTGMQPADNTPSMTPYMPLLPSAVSVADVIKSQIQFLQSNLKQIEHETANNKHQAVDETFIEHQRGLITSQISGLETLLESRLAQEGAMNTLRGDENHAGLGISVPPTDQNSEANPVLNNPVAPQPSKDASLSPSMQEEVAKSNAEAERTQAQQNNGEKKAPARSESISKSRLTMAAAMAPPFQPRARAVIAQSSQPQVSEDMSRSAVSSPVETQEQIESRLLAKCSTDWGYGGIPNAGAAATLTLSRTRSVQEPSTLRQNEVPPPPMLQRFNTFHGERTMPPMSSPPMASKAVPYLVGKPPNGVPASQVRESDFIYSRPLTANEVRARYLYWGKAPRSVQSGLPKFDGKDFYPPSPVKQDARLAPVTPVNKSKESQILGATVPQLNFENLFDSPGSPQHALTTERVAQFGQAWVHQPASYGSPEHGYGSLPFEPTAAGPSNSTQNGRFEEGLQQPQTPPRPISTQNLVITPVTEDFSYLFLERGVPGYKSPSPPHNIVTQPMKFDKEPVTPKNLGSPNESVHRFVAERIDTKNQEATESAGIDVSSTNSSVEFHLSPRNKARSPRASHEASFAERVENFRRYETPSK